MDLNDLKYNPTVKWYNLRCVTDSKYKQQMKVIEQYKEPTHYRQLFDNELNTTTLKEVVEAYIQWKALNKELLVNRTDLTLRDQYVASAETSRQKKGALLLSMKRVLISKICSFKAGIIIEVERVYKEFNNLKELRNKQQSEAKV